MRKVKIGIMASLLIIAILYAIGWATGWTYFAFKRIQCPDRWETGYGMPSIGESDYRSEPESRIYIKGRMYDASQFDQKWIRDNCAVNSPSRLPE